MKSFPSEVTVARRVSWKRMESELRVWAFHIYFERTFRDEKDSLLRFAKALEASSRPVQNRRLVREWYELYPQGLLPSLDEVST